MRPCSASGTSFRGYVTSLASQPRLATDLSTFTVDARGTDDARLAELVADYYQRVGDGALVVFDPDRADDAVVALLELKQDVDGWLAREGWSSRLLVKVHSGQVIAGSFGARAQERFDIIGSEVNVAARLQTRAFALSAQVFRLLSPAGRQRFKKHTPPIMYIRIEDRHPT